MLATFAFAAVAAGASAAQAATVLSVNASSLCATTGCFSETQRVFQRTWSGGDFSGATSIGAIALDRSLVGTMQDYAVRVSFQNAAGETVGTWGAFTVAVLSGQVVTLGGDAIDWDASKGALTLNLELLIPDKGGSGGFGGGGGGGGGGSFLSAGGTGAWHGNGPEVMPASPTILVPPPEDSSPRDLLPSVLAVPEPGAWALMVLGFAGAGAALRRSRRRLAPLKV